MSYSKCPAWLNKTIWIITALLVTFLWFRFLAPVFWRQGSSAAFDVTIGISIAVLIFLGWSIMRKPKYIKTLKQ